MTVGNSGVCWVAGIGKIRVCAEGILWHSLILQRYHPAFEFVPIESVIHERQSEYCAVLGECDRAGSSTAFIDFSLEVVEAALERFLESLRSEPVTVERRLELARAHFAEREFARKDYLRQFPKLSTATASRDLRSAVEEGKLEKTGEKAVTRYCFRR